MPIEIIYTVADRRGRTSTTSVKLGAAETAARVSLFAVAWADAIDNLIGGIIRSAAAVLRVDLTNITGNVVASGSDVEEIASAQFRTQINTLVEINVPAIAENLVTNETGELNQAAAAVQAFVAMMEDGITVGGVTVHPCDVGEMDVEELVYFRERSRNSGTRKKG